jgi:integrase
LTARLLDETPKSSLRLYFELLDAVFAAAVSDRVIPENPCAGVKLAQVLRGLSRAPKWVPNEDEVLALFDVVPKRYLAALWLGAGQGPKQHGGFHALRHFFATTLITNHAEPQEVQRLLRHKTLRIRLETYVHWWPKRNRRRGVVGSAL